MTYIDKIGNLKFWYEGTRRDMNVIAVNGTDVVAREVFSGAAPREAMRRMLEHFFDIYTRDDIDAAIPRCSIEYYGDLIYGEMAGFDQTDYFKRIDDTEFFQHYTFRPAMTGAELREA